MPDYDVVIPVSVTKTNMIDEMPCGYGTLRTTGVRIWHQVFHRVYAEVLSALKVSHRPVQRSQQLQNLTILMVKSCSILDIPRTLQQLSEARENVLALCESTLQSSRGGWEHLEVLKALVRATGVSRRFGYDLRTKLHFGKVGVLKTRKEIHCGTHPPSFWVGPANHCQNGREQIRDGRYPQLVHCFWLSAASQFVLPVVLSRWTQLPH